MSDPTLATKLEAILFVASEPLTLARLATATSSEPAQAKQALDELADALQGGIRLSIVGDTYRLVTAPDAAATIKRFLQDESKAELSRPALETLAIVAYRGPLTKSAIEQVRGVSSDVILRNLTARGLVCEAGKSAEPGRPVLYAISHAFLQHFGLTNLSDLPPIPGDSHEN